jgi:hypothetical protein
VKRFAVIAGNQKQARLWAECHHLQRQEWFYVAGPESLSGVRDVAFVWSGTYSNRPDYPVIESIAETLIAQGRAVEHDLGGW